MSMKLILTVFALFLATQIADAKDVYVNGYYRQNGTYVRPHIRSSPDAYKSNNYGPSKNSYELMNPKARDADRDGIPNYQDNDDNNNGISDNNE
uniref:Uncharacterized protein n=1 Tax=Chlorobium chlorochromatii (strain CaD3) TaxID=340177 RepID=Q3AQF9_CHLCH